MIEDVREKRRSRSDDDANEPSFVPPEAVAAEDDVAEMAKDTSPPEHGAGSKERLAPTPAKKPGKGKKPNKLKAWFHKLDKKQKIAFVLLVLLALGLAGFGLYTVLKPEPVPPAPVVEKKEEPPKPTTEASHLTGVQVKPELNKLPVTAIMIENSPDARPQSGLRDAGVVFEAIAEGGITRFLTLFQEAQPDYIGPVRSVRPYYLSWAKAFDAPIAHAGGSAAALAKIRNEGFKDLDQFHNAGAYQRITSRYAPHNLYTSRGSLLALQNSKGWTSSKFTGFARKAEKKLSPATAKKIDIAISGPLYNTHYDYDAASNSYLRSMAGKPHIDERSGKQIRPKVVIAIVLPQGIDPDGVHTSYQTIGNGKAYIFQDGGVTVGTWSKSADGSQIRFGNAKGSPIGLNPGQTWITAVGAAANVTSTP